MHTTETVQAFSTIFQIPEFIIPWLDRFFEEFEIELVLCLANTPLSAEEISRMFSSSELSEPSSELATRAYRRGILHRRDDNRFEPADFHVRFDKWVLFEGWKDIPEDVRNQLNAWELDEYDRQYARQLTGLQTGKPREDALIYPEYVLLHEAEALLDRAAHIYLMPCNCRAMMQNCSQSLYTCLRFENDRDLGWEISASRAKEIVRQAHQDGLMQSGEVRLADDGTLEGALCNCCADCCFPHKLAERYNAQKLWPLSRYVARYVKDRCIACGRCVRRCPFQAFTVEKKQQASERTIHFNPERCRGCGLCSTSCPTQAIELTRIDGRQSLVDDILTA